MTRCRMLACPQGVGGKHRQQRSRQLQGEAYLNGVPSRHGADGASHSPSTRHQTRATSWFSRATRRSSPTRQLPALTFTDQAPPVLPGDQPRSLPTAGDMRDPTPRPCLRFRSAGPGRARRPPAASRWPLLIVPLMFTLGMAYDYTMASNRKDQIDGMADAAALGAVTPAMMMRSSATAQARATTSSTTRSPTVQGVASARRRHRH